MKLILQHSRWLCRNHAGIAMGCLELSDKTSRQRRGVVHGGTKFDLGLVALLFPKAPHQNAKMGNYASIQLKQPNPGCYLSMWRSLKRKTNSLKNYLC